MMEKYFILKSGNHLLVLSIMDCPRHELVCLECNTEEELYKLIRKMDCEISFAQPCSWDSSRSVIRENKKGDFVFVKIGDCFKRVDLGKVKWIEADGSYVKLFMMDAKVLMLSFNLTEISNYLLNTDFVRVHRSYIVNVNYIDSFIGNILRIGEKRIPISKLHKKDVLRLLNLIG